MGKSFIKGGVGGVGSFRGFQKDRKDKPHTSIYFSSVDSTVILVIWINCSFNLFHYLHFFFNSYSLRPSHFKSTPTIQTDSARWKRQL